MTKTAVVRVATDGIAIGQTIHADPEPYYDIKAWHDRPTVSICTDVDGDGVKRFIAESFGVPQSSWVQLFVAQAGPGQPSSISTLDVPQQ